MLMHTHTQICNMDWKLCKCFLKWQQQTASLAQQTKDTWQIRTSKHHRHKCVEEKEDEFVRGRPKEDQDKQEE